MNIPKKQTCIHIETSRTVFKENACVIQFLDVLIFPAFFGSL